MLVWVVIHNVRERLRVVLKTVSHHGSTVSVKVTVKSFHRGGQIKNISEVTGVVVGQN